MKSMLISTAGDTPQVVTETLWCLITAHTPARPIDEVHVIATASTLARANQLSGEEGAIARLTRECRVAPPKVFIHVFNAQNASPLHDIRDGGESTAFAKGAANLVRKLTMDPDTTLYASIAGGRKTMGFLLGQAMELFGRPQDRLTHVLVEAKFEHCSEFWFPTTQSQPLKNRNGDPLDARDARLELVEIPFVRLRGKLTPMELQNATLEPGPLVGQIQSSILQTQITLEIEAVGASASGLPDVVRPLSSVLANLALGSSLGLRIITQPNLSDPGVRVLIDCQASAEQSALARSMASSLADDVLHALEEERTGYRVIPCTLEPEEFVPEWAASLMPKSRLLTAPWVKKLDIAAPEKHALNTIRLRINDTDRTTREFPIQAMVASGIPMEFQWIVERVDLDSDALVLVDAVHEELSCSPRADTGEVNYNDSCTLPVAFSTFAETILDGWKYGGSGFKTSVCIRASKPVPSALLSQIASATYARGESYEIQMGENFKRSENHVLDLSTSFGSNQVARFNVPSRNELSAAGVRNALPTAPRRLRMSGAELGKSGQNSIRLSEKDRDQHMYLLGGSGTGKSTLLRNLVIQDIEAGEGVFVLDPHGDLVDELLTNIPANRATDVVLLDVGDSDYPFGLNFLEPDRGNLGMSTAYITNELLAIFQRLYEGVPEALGPAFEQLFRAGIALLLDRDTESPSTFLDLLDLYVDAKFRDKLLSECKSKSARRLIELQHKGSGDHSWENFAAYVTNKFNRFTLNSQVRNIVCQPTSTTNFRTAMDEGKIVLVKMTKGVLGEVDVRMIGMLIVSRLFGAALSRADVATDKRRKLTVYIDEFQNFVTASIAQMIAEGRKYGLRLVLANQALAQLERPLCESVLSNASNLLAFRLGPMDAKQLEDFFGPSLCKADLQALPNYHCAARILHDGAPLLPPFVLKTRRPLMAQQPTAVPAELIAFSRHMYSRSRQEIEATLLRVT